MPITGSDKALMQARSGIARAGATRSGYYFPNVVLTVNGTNRSTAIKEGSLRISLAINDEPDTAYFTIIPNVFTPAVRQEVVIGLGTAANREFAGSIVNVRHRRVHGIPYPFFDVACVDWQRLFDRRLITTYYSSQSATSIVVDIVDNYTSGFTTEAVEADLPTVNYFPLTNAKPSEALKRLARLISGNSGFRIDADRRVHFWGSAGEQGTYTPTAPVTLTSSLATLNAFAHNYDVREQRTRVIGEGKSVAVLADVAVGQTIIPVETIQFMADPLFPGEVVRVEGHGLFTTNATFVGNSLTTTVSSNTSAGSTTLPVADVTIYGPTDDQWHKVGGELFIFSTGRTVTGPGNAGTLDGIPSSGPGSITRAVASGERVVNTAAVGFTQALSRTVLAGSRVFLRLTRDDAAEQAATAAIEGGDGIHERLVSDGRLDDDGLIEAADGDLNTYAAPLLRAEWETEDLNARPGRQQVINLSAPDALSTTLMITRTDLTFPVPNTPPIARCEAGEVPPMGILDRLAGEQA